MRRIIERLGEVGMIARAVIARAAGVFVREGALSFDPRRPKASTAP
jgi:hypothetical protein